MKTIQRARAIAEATPDSRNRYIDFLRAASILVVVFGHWLMAAPFLAADGELALGGLIGRFRSAQALTWLLQVMPIFFLVGGFANAGSWRSARKRGVVYPAWLRERLRRLLLPVMPLLAAWAAIAFVAHRAGIDTELIRVGSQAALVPVWFLATYVLVVTLVPATLGAWERFGWMAPIAATSMAALVDFVDLGFGFSPVRWLNYVFVWNAVHMLGYAWADGRSGRMPALVSATGFASLAALVNLGPYPLAMVGLDAAPVTNSNPPKLTLVALAVFQFGLARLLERPVSAWLARVKPWTGVVAVSGSIMTLYLWHLTAMVALIGAQLWAGGLGLAVAPASKFWWLTRPVWLAILITATVPLLGMFGRFERPAPDRRPAPRAWRPVAAAVLSCAGLGFLAGYGIADADGLNGLALSLPFAGIVIGGVSGSMTRRSTSGFIG